MEHIPPGHFILIARSWFFTSHLINHSGLYLTRILNYAGDEGSWLLERLGNDVPDFRNDFFKKIQWILKMIDDKEDGPWAHYYRGRALMFSTNVFDGIDLLKKSSDAGFLPAASLLGRMSDFVAGSKHYVQLSTSLNDPDGMYLLSYTERRFELLKKAAELGHTDSMHVLQQDFTKDLSHVELATICARYILLTAHQIGISRRRCSLVPYAFGRQLYGYEQLWDDNVRLIPQFQKHVNFYATVTERARRAALYTFMGLRPIIGKDVAVMIGKMVYGTRFTEDWN